MRTRIVTSLAGILVLLIGGLASADQFADGVAAYKAQDYKTAITKFTVLASTGHAEAQLFLAEMYSWGQGVDADFGRSIIVQIEIKPLFQIVKIIFGYRQRTVDNPNTPGTD